eukprot:9261501-Pyramimonas_sp.AAC.1
MNGSCPPKKQSKNSKNQKGIGCTRFHGRDAAEARRIRAAWLEHTRCGQEREKEPQSNHAGPGCPVSSLDAASPGPGPSARFARAQSDSSRARGRITANCRWVVPG